MIGAPWRIVSREEVGSTNDEAKALAAAGAGDFTVVWAKRQVSGRGRRGRRWESPQGNLYCSLIQRPGRKLPEAVQLGFVAALAVGGALASMLPQSVRLGYKWPNDVLADGKKISGILLESGGDKADAPWLVIGIGINIASHPDDMPYKVTSLKALGADVTVEAALDALLAQVAAWRARWEKEGFGAVRAAWLERALGLGERISVALGAATLDGRFVDLDGDGALVLEQGGARRRIHAGEVLAGTG